MTNIDSGSNLDYDYFWIISVNLVLEVYALIVNLMVFRNGLFWTLEQLYAKHVKVIF